MGVTARRPHAGPEDDTTTEPNTAPGGSPVRGYPLPAATAEGTDDEGDVVIVERPPVRGVLGRAARWVRIKWFQYEITFGSYCFEWWEKAMIHLLVLGVLVISVYGIWRQVRWTLHMVSGIVGQFAPSLPASINGGGGGSGVHGGSRVRGAHSGAGGAGFSSQGAPTI